MRINGSECLGIEAKLGNPQVPANQLNSTESFPLAKRTSRRRNELPADENELPAGEMNFPFGEMSFPSAK
jgi:hypothetical protein